MHGSIHIKLEYPEAVESKKNMLLLEKSMLQIVKHMRAYDLLRKREFNIKTEIKKNFANLVTLISTIESHIPKEEAEFKQEVYKKEIKAQNLYKKHQKKVTEQKKSEIENQIDEIRAKLAQLG